MKSLKERREQFMAGYPVWNAQTLYQRFRETASQGEDKIFFIDDGQEYNYREALQLIEQTASALRAIGVRDGSCVAVALKNSIYFVAITFALAKLGAVKIPINGSAGFAEAREILRQSKAKFFFTEREADVAKSADIQGMRKIIGLHLDTEESEKVLSWEHFLEKGKGILTESVYQDADGVSDIIYTSGSTGTPKGVMLTHDMLLRSAFASCINRGFEEGRRIYVPLPLFHVYGYVEGLLSVLFVNGSILITRGKFDVQKALSAMEKHQANDLLGVPSIIMKILQYPQLGEYSLELLKGVYCSASFCPKWVWKAIREKLHVKEVITGYGMSEVSGASIQTDPLDDDRILESRVGKVLYGGCAGDEGCGKKVIEYRVIDGDTGKDMPFGQYGELICRGPIVTKGYYLNPEANAFAMLGGGWMRTGDIGYFDENGYLKLLGRCNDLYKINGENVSPQFLDKVIAGCAGVFAVETVGVPDEKLGWVGAAFIDAHDPDEEEKERIIRYCKENLAPYQVPRYFFFTHSYEWPHTSTGKVMKYKLREMAEKMMENGEGNAIRTMNR